MFIYEIKRISLTNSIIKRTILSDIAKIFDPLGLLGPIILFAKKIMQEIWKRKIEWDEAVPSSVQYSWNEFCSQLNSIENITFDRQIISFPAEIIELHGFCDASEIGYGACIYLRSKFANSNKFNISLVCSKSRVAPIKTRTLPRLELCGAKLLADLYQQVSQSLNIQLNNSYLWSDSSIVLNWIKTTPNSLKTFVANRVAEIQLKTNSVHWRHVRSNDNPADALSRGQLPHNFLENQLWLRGPVWLQDIENNWPNSNIPGFNEIPESRNSHCFVTQLDSYAKHLISIIEKQSSYSYNH